MKKRLIPLLIAILAACPAWAAPSVSGVSGTITHGNTITISGSGFGSKGSAAPVVWDDCSGTDPYAKWDINYNSGSSASYVGGYRTPAALGRGVSLPHSRATKYFCGAHYPGGAQSGSNVGLAKIRTVSSYPCYTYISYYNRIDPNYDWSPSSTDDNFKEYDWSYGSWPYGSESNWYIEWYYPLVSNCWHLNDDSLNENPMLMRPTSGWYMGTHWNAKSSWAKIEIAIVHSASDSVGSVKVWENGTLKVDFDGSNTFSSTGTYTELIGGYARDWDDDNWRYWVDIYYDHSLQRILIGNASTLSACTTLREVQIPSTWSDTSITATVNQGGFADAATAYLYVFDATGAASSGYLITFGSSGADTFTLTGSTFSSGGTLR